MKQPAALIYRTPKPAAKMRLFCLPFSGGSAQLFRDWGALFPDAIEVVPVEYPGRTSRFGEPLRIAMDTLVDDVVTQMQPLLDLPFGIFGHSLGGRVAFEVALALRDRKLPTPKRVFPSAAPTPDTPLPNWNVMELPESTFKDYLKSMGSIPQEVLNDAGMMSIFIPILRADFTIAATYQRAAGDAATIDAPLTVFVAKNDTICPAEMTALWNQFTRAGVRRVEFDAGHFFMGQEKDALIREMVRDLLET